MNEPDHRSAVVDVAFVGAVLDSALLPEPILRAAATQPLKTGAQSAI